MDKFLEFLNKNINNTYLKLVSVVYDKDAKVATFKFIYDNSIPDDERTRLSGLISDYYENKFKVEVKLKRSYLDEDALQEFCYRNVLENCKSILDFNKKDVCVAIDEKQVKIDLNIAEQFVEFLQNKSYDRDLVKNLGNNFFGEFQVEIHAKKPAYVDDVIKEKEEELDALIASTVFDSEKKIEVEITEPLFGEISDNSAIELGGIKSARSGIQVCGKLLYYLKKTFVSKRKDAEGNAVEKEFFSFSLDDGTGKLQAVVFPNKLTIDKLNELQEKDGLEVIAGGDVEEYNGRLSLKVKAMSLCKLPEKKEEVVEQKEVNTNYIYVKPEPYINMSQDNFLAKAYEPSEFLKQNDVVVFDFETTGFEFNKNEIIEIGAVKLKNGEISEAFSTFVKPKNSIPEEITNLTHITNEMVKDAYPIEKIIPDFYKFCYGCVIMAYNIDFDYKFLDFNAKKLGYNFNNRQVDALYLARLNVAGAKNFKLGSICAKLGVSLEGAHRAVNDAVATAEVVKLISYNVSPK